MQPHAVSRVLAYDGKVLKEFAPDPLRQALSKETAAELGQLLDNVTDGTARSLSIDGISVGGMVATQFPDKHELGSRHDSDTARARCCGTSKDDNFSDQQQISEANVAAVARITGDFAPPGL